MKKGRRKQKTGCQENNWKKNKKGKKKHLKQKYI